MLRRGDVSLSLFTPRGADHQSVHKQDEVYLVIAGTGLLRSGDVEHAFVPGDALYVAAGQEHRFVGDLTGLVMWVVFWTCRPAGDPRRREEHQQMTATQPPQVHFTTTVAVSGNNTGIVVPPELIRELGAGARPPVLVEVNGYSYRTTVGVMKGTHMIGISMAIRKAIGLAGGDPIAVSLTLAHTPREVNVPDDLAQALAAAGTEQFFGSLSNSVQRFHVDTINGAKTDETRRRRIDKAIALFLQGRPR